MANRKKQSSKAINGNVVSADFNKTKEVEDAKGRDDKWEMLQQKEVVDCSWHEDPHERFFNELGWMYNFLETRGPDGCCLTSYQMEDFPRDIKMGEKYDAVKAYPREVVDAWLLQDCVQGNLCFTHGAEFLKKVQKKYDSIQKKADKQWLRFVVKEAYELGVFDEGGDDANLIS